MSLSQSSESVMKSPTKRRIGRSLSVSEAAFFENWRPSGGLKGCLLHLSHLHMLLQTSHIEAGFRVDDLGGCLETFSESTYDTFIHWGKLLQTLDVEEYSILCS